VEVEVMASRQTVDKNSGNPGRGPAGGRQTPARPIITLTTDFGTKDAFVAAMKGVILGLNPEATLVDLTHEIPPLDVTAGAFALAETSPYFPQNTIFLAVVDPGVGTPRRGLAAQAQGRYFVGPDNGLFHFIFQDAADLTIFSLENSAFFRPQVSATFHGRDIFAPVAAHLSLGVALKKLGRPVTDPVLLPISSPTFIPEAARGEIIYVDRFGNLVSNIAFDKLAIWLGGRQFHLHIGPHILTRFSRTYGDVEPGEFLALNGSHGYLEIACNRAHAAERLDWGVGAVFTIHLR
jgi:S-adenosylmethionine hydrolase